MDGKPNRFVLEPLWAGGPRRGDRKIVDRRDGAALEIVRGRGPAEARLEEYRRVEAAGGYVGIRTRLGDVKVDESGAVVARYATVRFADGLEIPVEQARLRDFLALWGPAPGSEALVPPDPECPHCGLSRVLGTFCAAGGDRCRSAIGPEPGECCAAPGPGPLGGAPRRFCCRCGVPPGGRVVG